VTRAIWPIARMTMVEASRRRMLLALAVLTFLLIVGVGYGFYRLPELGGSRRLNHDDLNQVASVLTILTFFMFSFVLTFAAVFVAAPAISSDVESGVILSIVPRPIRRSDIVLGRWLGLTVVVVVYTMAATLLELEVVNLVIGYVPPHPFEAIAFLVAEGIVAVTMGLLFSTRLAPMTGALAGAGGVIFAFYSTEISFGTGFTLGLFAFTAAVLGGIGNLPGAVLGALLIGLIQNFNEGLGWYAPGSKWTESLVFAILILILVFRPQGLLGERTPEGG